MIRSIPRVLKRVLPCYHDRFVPSKLLSPKDVFALFDRDGSGRIDELDFADVLDYFGLDVTDGKQEKLFHKYDRDESGYIDVIILSYTLTLFFSDGHGLVTFHAVSIIVDIRHI
jgi:hypothetical protein